MLSPVGEAYILGELRVELVHTDNRLEIIKAIAIRQTPGDLLGGVVELVGLEPTTS